MSGRSTTPRALLRTKEPKVHWENRFSLTAQPIIIFWELKLLLSGNTMRCCCEANISTFSINIDTEASWNAQLRIFPCAVKYHLWMSSLKASSILKLDAICYQQMVIFSAMRCRNWCKEEELYSWVAIQLIWSFQLSFDIYSRMGSNLIC